MQLLARHARGVLLLVLFALTSACASFPGESVKSAKLPDMAGKAYKPSAYIDARFFQGKPGAGATEIPAAKGTVEAAVNRALAQNSPFSRYTFDAFEQDKVDHVVRLHYYNHGETGGAAILGFISGFTFGVIPAVAKDNYTLVASASTPKGTGSEHRSNDHVTTWMGLIFLPMSGKTPQKAVEATLTDLTRDGLRQIVGANQLTFVAPVAPVAPLAEPGTAASAAAAPAAVTGTPLAPAPAPAPSPQQ